MPIRFRLQSSAESASIGAMSKAATIETAERQATHQAQAEHYLAQANRILKRLSHERLRHDRRRAETPDILTTVKSILRGGKAC
jgi:glucose-6-phosphate dehydrogenase assembly protein OpcA